VLCQSHFAELLSTSEDQDFADLRLAEGSGRPLGTAEFVPGLKRLLGRTIARRAPGRKPTADVTGVQLNLLQLVSCRRISTLPLVNLKISSRQKTTRRTIYSDTDNAFRWRGYVEYFPQGNCGQSGRLADPLIERRDTLWRFSLSCDTERNDFYEAIHPCLNGCANGRVVGRRAHCGRPAERRDQQQWS
jgi:hypothetical protein